MSWEEILMDAGIAAIVVGIIGVISGLFKIIYDSKRGTDKLQQDHTELNGGQVLIKEVIKESNMNVLSELKSNTATINSVDKMLAESKVNQLRDYESLSKDQKEIKDHMDAFKRLLSDWERQATIINELKLMEQKINEKNVALEKKIDEIIDENKQLRSEVQKLHFENEKSKDSITHNRPSKVSVTDIENKIKEYKNENMDRNQSNRFLRDKDFEM